MVMMKVIVMMMMVMMMKVIMLVSKTSVCRKVTPTHRVPEHPLLPFLNLASQATPVPGEDNNENDDKVETIKEASKENTCNIILHDDVTCIFFLFIDFISTSFRLQTFRVMGGHEMLDLEEWGMVREYNVFLSWRGNGIYRSFYLYFSIFGER